MDLSPSIKDLYRQFRNSLAIQLLVWGFTFVFAGALPEQIYQIYYFFLKFPSISYQKFTEETFMCVPWPTISKKETNKEINKQKLPAWKDNLKSRDKSSLIISSLTTFKEMSFCKTVHLKKQWTIKLP